ALRSPPLSSPAPMRSSSEALEPSGNCCPRLRRAGARRPLKIGGDRRFESLLLQRRVSLTGVFGGSRRKSPAFAGSVSLDVTRERDGLARTRLALAPFSDGH